jgi:subtilisin family serine protease
MKLIHIILISLFIIFIVFLIIFFYKKKEKFTRIRNLDRFLQFVTKTNRKIRNDNIKTKTISPRSSVLSFSGGGIRSITVCTGVTVGLLRKLTKINGTRTNLNEYLKQYRVISGNSGGSWFMTLLGYSKNYYNMLNSAGDLNNYPIAGKKLQCSGGEPIPGSEDWYGYCDFRDNMQSCGDKCCCNVGFEYEGGRWGLDRCVKCKEDKGDICKDNTDIPNSNRWWSCWYNNTYTCGKHCCCDTHYEPDSRGNCRHCLPPKKDLEFTFYEYMNKIFQVIDNWRENRNNLIIDAISELSPNWVRPFLYYYYSPWYRVTNEIIFNTVGDIDSNTTLSEEVNDIRSHFVWSTAILRYSNIMNLKNDKHVNYYMNNPSSENEITSKKLKNENKAFNDLEQNGMVFPAFFNYDFITKQSPINIFAGEISDNNSMIYDYDDTELYYKDFLNNSSSDDRSKVSVLGASACSGAPVGFLSSKTVLKQALETAPENAASEFLTSLGSERISEEISSGFNDASISVRLNGKNKKIDVICNPKNITSLDCTEFDYPNADVKNVSEIKDQKIVKMVDGAFYDNSSVAYAVKAWQDNYKDSPDNKCKIVYINSIPNDSSFSERRGDQMKTNQNIFCLFGCEPGTENVEYANCSNTNKIFNYLGPDNSEKAWISLPTVFKESDYQDGKLLWWKRCNKNSRPNKECQDEDNICYAEMSVVYFDTITVNNKELGIKAGTYIELFTINFNTTKAPIFINPGSSDEETDLSNYITTATEISNLTEDLDNALFELIFTEKHDNKPNRDRIISKFSSLNHSRPGFCGDDNNVLIENFNSKKYTGKNQNIFIFDTGIHVSHEEFSHKKPFNLRVNNKDIPELQNDYETTYDLSISYENNDNYNIGQNGHGTSVACIIGGKDIGISPNVNIYGLKTGRIFNNGKTVEEHENHMLSSLRSANAYVKKHKIKNAIFSISTGQTYWNEENFSRVAEESKSLGIVWIVSASNNYENHEDFVPANLKNINVITVGSIGHKKHKTIDIYVEGRNIYTCGFNNNSYINSSGTSMSTPKVSAFLATLLEKYEGDMNKALQNLHHKLVDKILIIE